MLITLVASLMQISSMAQSMAQSVEQTPAQSPGQCGYFVVEIEGDQITLFRDYGKNFQAVRVTNIATVGKELLNSGIDVQTDEPQDWVAIQEKHDELNTGKFELVYKDHTLIYTDGKAERSVPTYNYTPCNSTANDELQKLLDIAKAARQGSKPLHF